MTTRHDCAGLTAYRERLKTRLDPFDGFLVRCERKGEVCDSRDPLILMGDWCGEESLTDTHARNPGKGEEEAPIGALLE